MNAIFYVSALVALTATALAITRANAVHALLHFIISLLATGVMFFAIGAPFAAALVIIVNAGAIMVLFVFVIMTLNLRPQPKPSVRGWPEPKVWAGPAVLGAVLLVELVYCVLNVGGAASGTTVGPQWVGMALFGPYLLGVELASMLLLTGLLGAYHLGEKAMKRKGETS